MHGFSIKIALLPKLVIWDCLYHNVNASNIEAQLQVLNQSMGIDTVLKKVKGKKIYFQNSAVCDEYDNSDDELSFEIEYPLTYGLIIAADACKTVCTDGDPIVQLTCSANWYHNGECIQDCNKPSCGYDGGDCTQLCDFSICNSECDNKECSFDYCDCFFDNININSVNNNNVSQSEKNQCSVYNATLCQINSDCVAFDVNTSESWIGDNICDNYCNNICCNFDNDDCSKCQDTTCEIFYQYFNIIADYENEDGKISVDEMCLVWDSFAAYVGNTESNCTQWCAAYDINNDTILHGC